MTKTLKLSLHLKLFHLKHNTY